MPTITLTDEEAQKVIVALCERTNKADQTLAEALMASEAELSVAKARIAELEAENTPPEGCDASWRRSNMWIAPLDERGVHEIRWANGDKGSYASHYVKAEHGVTFP